MMKNEIDLEISIRLTYNQDDHLKIMNALNDKDFIAKLKEMSNINLDDVAFSKREYITRFREPRNSFFTYSEDEK